MSKYKGYYEVAAGDFAGMVGKVIMVYYDRLHTGSSYDMLSLQCEDGRKISVSSLNVKQVEVAYEPVDSPLKWHGGKSYLAKKIVELMPHRKNKHHPTGYLHYVEPYAGGLSVLLANDPEGISEVVNDIHLELSNFWGVLQNKPLFDAFLRTMQVMPFSEPEFEAAEEVSTKLRTGSEPDIAFTLATNLANWCDAESVARAITFFVRCRQSLSGRMKDFAPLTRARVRRGMNEQASAWLSCVEGLPLVHERLKRVVILNKDALAVIRQQDGPDTLFYLDPPYLPSTRSSPDVYAHEMSIEQHKELLALLLEIKGRFILSGYQNVLYHNTFADAGKTYREVTFDLPNNAAGGKTKRRMTECLWLNY